MDRSAVFTPMRLGSQQKRIDPLYLMDWVCAYPERRLSPVAGTSGDTASKSGSKTLNSGYYLLQLTIKDAGVKVSVPIKAGRGDRHPSRGTDTFVFICHGVRHQFPV
jgi:hypothetical protein